MISRPSSQPIPRFAREGLVGRIDQAERKLTQVVRWVLGLIEQLARVLHLNQGFFERTRGGRGEALRLRTQRGKGGEDDLKVLIEDLRREGRGRAHAVET